MLCALVQSHEFQPHLVIVAACKWNICHSYWNDSDIWVIRKTPPIVHLNECYKVATHSRMVLCKPITYIQKYYAVAVVNNTSMLKFRYCMFCPVWLSKEKNIEKGENNYSPSWSASANLSPGPSWSAVPAPISTWRKCPLNQSVAAVVTRICQ